MSTQSDFTKQPDQILLDLIKEQNPLTSTFTGAEYTSAPPAVVVAGNETDPTYMNRKTKLTLSAVQGSGYKDSRDIFYNRVHWRDVMVTADPLTTEFGLVTDPIVVHAETTLSELVTAINAKFALNLTADDYVDLPLPPFTGDNYEGATVRFAAQATSKIFVGGVLLSIKPNLISLMQALPTNVLNGLVYVQPDATAIALRSTLTQMAQPGYW